MSSHARRICAKLRAGPSSLGMNTSGPWASSTTFSSDTSHRQGGAGHRKITICFHETSDKKTNLPTLHHFPAVVNPDPIKVGSPRPEIEPSTSFQFWVLPLTVSRSWARVNLKRRPTSFMVMFLTCLFKTLCASPVEGRRLCFFSCCSFHFEPIYIIVQ